MTGALRAHFDDYAAFHRTPGNRACHSVGIPLIVFAVAFVIITGAAALKGRPRREAASHGFLWSTLSTWIFVSTGVYRSRKGQRCALWGDPTEMPHA